MSEDPLVIAQHGAEIVRIKPDGSVEFGPGFTADEAAQEMWRVIGNAFPWVADPRFAAPVGENEVAGLAVAFKALVLRAGGRVEITEAELHAAERTLCRVDATPALMSVEVVEGAPPETPRFAAEGA